MNYRIKAAQVARLGRKVSASAQLGEHHWEYRISPEEVAAHDAFIKEAIAKYGREKLNAIVAGKWTVLEGISTRDKIMLEMAKDEIIAYLTGYAPISDEETLNNCLYHNLDVFLNKVSISLQTVASKTFNIRGKSVVANTRSEALRKVQAEAEDDFDIEDYIEEARDFVRETINNGECELYDMDFFNEYYGGDCLRAAEDAVGGCRYENSADSFDSSADYFAVSFYTDHEKGLTAGMLVSVDNAAQYLTDIITTASSIEDFKEWLSK